MRQQTEEVFNIEKNKELFAYEMTEVYLALKGEFASISEKDLGYSQFYVTEKERNLPLSVIPQTRVEAVQMQLPQIPVELPGKLDIAFTAFENDAAEQGVVVTKPALSLPEVRPIAYKPVVLEWKADPAEKNAFSEQIPDLTLPAMAPVPKVVRKITGVQIPNIRSFGQLQHSVEADAPAPKKTEPSCVPKIEKIQMPCMPDVQRVDGAAIEVPVVIAVKMKPVAKPVVEPVAATIPAVTKPVTAVPTFRVTLPRQTIVLPDVLHCSQRMAAVDRPCNIEPIVTALPDVQKEYETFLAALAETF